MEDSGVVGINMIPSEWTVLKLKQLTNQPFQYGLNESAVDNVDGDPRYIRITDITTNGLLRKDTVKTMQAEKARGYLLQDGDLLFARSGATAGKPFMYRESYGVSCFAGYLIRFVPNRDKLLPRFLDFVSQSVYYENWKNSIFIQATIQNISADKYKELLIPIPSQTEQNCIANFLDEKTAVIDEVVKKKKKQIELLKEKRAALITQAVTKGLDLNVKMKDSGVEWIGEIPEGWEVERLKRISQINKSVLGESTPSDLEIEYVDIGSVKSNGSIAKIEHYSFEKAPSRARRTVQTGTVIFATVRPYLKAVTEITEELSKVIVSTGFATIEPGANVSSRYLYYTCASSRFVDEATSRAVGISYPAINSSAFGMIEVPLPEVDSQKHIADFLDEKTAVIDNTIKKIQKSVKLIQEYRSSLISHAVTGKIIV